MQINLLGICINNISKLDNCVYNCVCVCVHTYKYIHIYIFCVEYYGSVFSCWWAWQWQKDVGDVSPLLGKLFTPLHDTAGTEIKTRSTKKKSQKPFYSKALDTQLGSTIKCITYWETFLLYKMTQECLYFTLKCGGEQLFDRWVGSCGYKV